MYLTWKKNKRYEKLKASFFIDQLFFPPPTIIVCVMEELLIPTSFCRVVNVVVVVVIKLFLSTKTSTTECFRDLDWTLAIVARWLFSGHFWPLLKREIFFEETWAIAKYWLEPIVKASFKLSLSKLLILTVEVVEEEENEKPKWQKRPSPGIWIAFEGSLFILVLVVVAHSK